MPEGIKWGPIGQEVYERTYMRVKANGENETWEDTVRRVVEGNTGLVASKYIEPDEKQKLFDLIYNFKMIPAGRHLWVSGVPGRQFLFNCHRAAFDDTLQTHYAFAFDELMKGGGVGANYSNRYLTEQPYIRNTVQIHITCDPAHPDYNEMLDAGVISTEFSHLWDGAERVEDSREGWVAALSEMLNASVDHSIVVPNKTLVFDVSNVREKGAPIRGFGGTASGPIALAIMLHKVADVLNSNFGKNLKSLDHMLIDHRIAECVVAGNVRRSARMSIKSWLDDDIFDFIDCKKDSGEHWSTNISVEIDDGFFIALKSKKHELHEHANEVYQKVIEGMFENGEPGFYNISLASVGELGDVGSTNPCGEIALEQWENCNLGHINVSAFYNDFEASKEAFRLMTRFLMRATFGDVPNPLQREVVDRNRRIGVGFFGYQGWLVKQGLRYSDSHRDRNVRKTLRDWKAVVDKEKVRYAHQLRIPIPIKGTTLAPTGTIAKLPGASESIQTIYSPYFKRRVRYGADSPKLVDLAAQGYEIEDDIYTANTKVVTFYVKDPLVAEVETLGFDPEIVEGAQDVSLTDFLSIQAMVQEHYADNAISFTVNIEPDDRQREFLAKQIENNVPAWALKVGPPSFETVERAKSTIIHYLPNLKGTTIMIDGSRPQSPYERISRAEYELYDYISTMGSGELACGPNGCPEK